MKHVAKAFLAGAFIWVVAFMISLSQAALADIYGVTFNPETTWSNALIYTIGLAVGWMIHEI